MNNSRFDAVEFQEAHEGDVQRHFSLVCVFHSPFFPNQWYSAMCLMINTKIPQKLETAGSQLKEWERHGIAVCATQSEISSQLHK